MLIAHAETYTSKPLLIKATPQLAEVFRTIEPRLNHRTNTMAISCWREIVGFCGGGEGVHEADLMLQLI